MRKAAALFLCISESLCLHAQTSLKSDSLSKITDSLKLVTVTATRTIKDIIDVGRSVTIISAEQIRQSGATTVSDLLSQQEGIYIVGEGQNPGAVQNLFMRGADENHTTVMIDGNPISDPSGSNGAIDLSELSLAGIDRIEIVRGTHSVLYGSSSIGGVINIITKKNYAPGIHVAASVTGGTFGTQTSSFNENLLLNYTWKNGFYATGGVHRLDVKGLNATVDSVTVPMPYDANPDRDNFNKTDVFSKLGFHNEKLNAYVEYKNTSQLADLDANAFTDAQNYTGNVTRNFYNAFASYTLSPVFHIQYNGSYSPVQRKYIEDTNIIDVYGDKYYQSQLYKSTTMTHDLQATYNFKTSQFVIGGGAYTESMHFNSLSIYDEYPYRDSVNPVTESISNVYAQADINGATFKSAWRALSLLMGARYSSNSICGSNVSYEVNPYIKTDANTLLYLSYSTGFNAPALYQLYSPDKGGYNPATSVTRGNANLTPETSSSFEVGLKHRISNLYFTLSWFNTVVNNHIDYVYLWNGNKPIDSLSGTDYMGDTYLNIGQEKTQGFELNCALQLNKKLNVSANISLLSSSLNYSTSDINTTQTHGAYVQVFDGGGFLTQDIKGQGLLRRPGSTANIVLSYNPCTRFNFTIKARYVGTRSDGLYDYALGPYGAESSTLLGDYTLVGASATYKVCKNASVMLRVENVFNTSYYEILGYTTLGRAIYLNLNYAF